MGHIVDLSYHNQYIDWGRAYKEIDLAILRVQYGSNKVDSKYKEYVTGCEAYGIPHGAYAYGCYVSVADAVVEAKDFMSRVDKNAKFLVLDVEDDTLASCGAKDLAKASQAFIDTCRNAGWKIGLYVSHHMYKSYGLDTINADFLWIPRYGNKPAYACDIWQYTETGSIAGISTNVDINRLNSDKSLSWFTNKNKGETFGMTAKSNIIQSGAFSPYEVPDVVGALNSVKMTATFILQSNGLTYFVTDPTSENQFNAMTEWLDRKEWFYEKK